MSPSRHSLEYCRPFHEIAFMPFSARTYNCLMHAGLLLTSQIRAMSDAELLRRPRLGCGTLREIRQVVAAWDPEEDFRGRTP